MRRGDIFFYDPQGEACIVTTKGHPMLIVSNDKANLYSPYITCVPLTTNFSKKMPTHIVLTSPPRFSIALCEDVTAVCKNDLASFYWHITEEEMASVEKGLKIQLGLLK